MIFEVCKSNEKYGVKLCRMIGVGKMSKYLQKNAGKNKKNY